MTNPEDDMTIEEERAQVLRLLSLPTNAEPRDVLKAIASLKSDLLDARNSYRCLTGDARSAEKWLNELEDDLLRARRALRDVT